MPVMAGTSIPPRPSAVGAAPDTAGGSGLNGASANRRAHAAGDESFIMLVSKPPLPPFQIPYPQPPAEVRVSELRRAILDIYAPPAANQLTVTYAEQLRLATLTNWRLTTIELHLHQNGLIDPETRDSAVQQIGYRLEDDHECSLIEDGDEIHISLKPGSALSELQLPKVSVYSAPANVVSLTRKGTLSQPPPYALLAPGEPSSHSSSIAGQPNANYHSHKYVNDWRAPFRAVTARNVTGGVARREAPGINGAIAATPGSATVGSVLRHMPHSKKKPSRRRTPSANQTAGDEGKIRVSSTARTPENSGRAESAPEGDALDLPPTARVIGSGVQGTVGATARVRNDLRQKSSSGNAAPRTLSFPTASDGKALNLTPLGATKTTTSRPAGVRHHTGGSGSLESNHTGGTSHLVRGGGVRRSSASSREAKAAFHVAPAAVRPAYVKQSSSGYQSWVSNATTASATAAFVSSPTSVTTPPIVNLSPFPEGETSAANGRTGPSGSTLLSSEVSAAMLKNLRRARSSFAAAPFDDTTAIETGGNGVIRVPPVDDSDLRGDSLNSRADGDGASTGSDEHGTEGRGSKGKGKAVEKERSESEAMAQRADKRYRDVRATLEREISKQAAADEARAAQIVEEAARREEERLKKSEEERKQAVREKWALWEEVKKREKREMKDRKRRGQAPPEEAREETLGPTGAQV
ncbi:hypothetical protein V8E36_005716 [Tilletia maclaganii]